MGKIKVIAEIEPKGDFPVVSAPNVAVGDTTLTAALNAKANTSDVNTALGNKVDKVSGKGLSTNDYTTAEKNKLAAIEAQANKTEISTSIPASPTHGTVPSMKLVADTYASNSDLVSAVSTLNTAIGTKADASTVTSLSNQVSTNTSNIATQTARIDAIAALPSGSTSGDAELMDIRVKADGTTATNAGTAVREQINDLHYILDNYNSTDALKTFASYANKTHANVQYTWSGNTCTTSGTTSGTSFNDLYISSNEIPAVVSARKKFLVKYSTTNPNVTLRVGAYVGSSYVWRTYTSDGLYELPENSTGFCVRLFIEGANVNANATVTVSVITGLAPEDNLKLYNLQDSVAKNYQIREASAGTDLNTLSDSGYYSLAYSGEYSNCPIPKDSRRLLEVMIYTNALQSQRITNLLTGECYVRCKATDWSPWIKADDFIPITVVGGSDLNNVNSSGYCQLAYSGEYDNCPIQSGRPRFFEVFTSSARSIVQRITDMKTGRAFIRRKTSEGWEDWKNVNDISETARTKTLTTVNETHTNNFQNTGTKVTVLSYNICNFNFNSENYVSDEKLTNIKKMLMRVNADFIGLQENYPTIDANAQKSSNEYVYYPIYPNVYGNNGVSIASKSAAVYNNIVSYTNGRTLRYATYTINNKTLLLVSTHPVSAIDGYSSKSTEMINARRTQYEECFSFINHEITLNAYGTTTPITCPEWDWCIICADTNSITDTDKLNLKTLATSYNFRMANGDYIGWLETGINAASDLLSIDNIICSDNIIINYVDSLGDWYDRLYSDHYPIYADLTLTNSAYTEPSIS